MAINQNLLDQIRRRRAQFGAKRRKPKKTKKWLLPVSVEKYYQKSLVDHIRWMKKITKEVFPIAVLESLVSESNLYLLDRKDGWIDGANRMLALLALRLEKESQLEPLPLAEEIGARTQKWNDNQWRKVMTSALGVELYSMEPWLIDEMKGFTTQNVALIKSLENETYRNVERTIIAGVQAGDRHTTIAKKLYGIDKGVFKKSETRAKLIGRDQVSKFNGRLTQMRQTNVGVSYYIWQDSGDERVRPAHRANDGKKFSWASPPIDTGHPGQDINCRCWAEPVFPESFYGIK